jgi:hypothetical protein
VADHAADDDNAISSSAASALSVKIVAVTLCFIPCIMALPKGMTLSFAKLFDVSDYRGDFSAGGKCSIPTAPGICFERLPVPLPVIPCFIESLKKAIHKQELQHVRISSRCVEEVEVDSSAIAITNPIFDQRLKEFEEEIFKTLGADTGNDVHRVEHPLPAPRISSNIFTSEIASETLWNTRNSVPVPFHWRVSFYPPRWVSQQLHHGRR